MAPRSSRRSSLRRIRSSDKKEIVSAESGRSSIRSKQTAKSFGHFDLCSDVGRMLEWNDQVVIQTPVISFGVKMDEVLSDRVACCPFSKTISRCRQSDFGASVPVQFHAVSGCYQRSCQRCDSRHCPARLESCHNPRSDSPWQTAG
jgi:hypothetical protein